MSRCARKRRPSIRRPLARCRLLSRRVAGLIALTLAFLVHGLPGAVAQQVDQITAQQIQARLDVVAAQPDLTEEVRQEALANYRAAQERLTAAADARTNAEALRASAANAEKEGRALESQRQEVLAELATVDRRLRSVDAAEASQRLVALNAEQLALRERKDALERQLAGRLTRPVQLRDEIASATVRAEELVSQIEALEGVSSEPEQSERTLRRAQLEAVQEERQRLQTALATLAQRLDLAELELQLVTARRSLNERETTVLAAKVAEERQSESARAARTGAALREQALQLPPPLDEDAAQVAALYDELSRTLTATRRESDRVKQLSTRREQLKRDYDAIRSRVEVAGAQVALGQLLRNQRLQLPEPRDLQRSLAEARERSARAGLRNLELVDLVRQHDAWEEQLAQHIDAIAAERQAAAEAAARAEAEAAASAEAEAAARAEAEAAAKAAAEAAAKDEAEAPGGAGGGGDAGAPPGIGASGATGATADGAGTGKPGDGSAGGNGRGTRDGRAGGGDADGGAVAPAPAPPPLSIAQLEALAAEVAQTRLLGLRQLRDTYSQYVTLLADSSFEQQALLELVREYRHYLDERLLWVPSAERIGRQGWDMYRDAGTWMLSAPHWAVAVETVYAEVVRNAGWYLTGLLVLLLAVRVRSRLKEAIRDLGARTRKVRTDGFVLTLEGLIYTALLAALLPAVLVALGIRWQMLPLPEQARGVAVSLVHVGATLALCAFVRRLCMPQGLARLHFQWSEMRIQLWSRAAVLITLLWLPLYGVAKTAELQSNPDVQSTLGRLATLGLSLVLAYVFYLLLHPRRGLPAPSLSANPDSWAARLVRIWYPAAVGVPLVLAVVSLLGYQYAATLLLRCVVETVLLLSGGMLLFDLLERWIRVTRRRYRYRELLERRAGGAREEESQPATSPDAPALPYSAEREGAWQDIDAIDIDVFDDQTRRLMGTLVITLSLFGLWFIWSKALPVLDALDQVDVLDETGITLANAVIAGITAFLVLLATRNLPALLEFAVLKYLPIDAGARYAIRTVTQYLLVATGILVVTAQLGLAWNKVQWLVAALSVGLGFGLQEIFANFVSGLIILLERPVRVGDTVTVGDVSGTVTRIRIRATTITDWDNKEVIVPNKTFITGQLTNWTLSSEITRVVVPVGIAYGSDVALAVRVIMETAQRNPLVLAEPAPRVLFASLGDSALQFDVFLYCRALGDRLPARHQFLLDVDAALREHGITIPFPQRDVHLHMRGAGLPAGVAEAAAQGEARESVRAPGRPTEAVGGGGT